jgi:hypothetical protein
MNLSLGTLYIFHCLKESKWLVYGNITLSPKLYFHEHFPKVSFVPSEIVVAA